MAAKSNKMGKFTYNKITREDSETLGSGWRHCVHVMFHAPMVTPVHLFGNPEFEIKHTIMMQMRFDGRLGFPGGFVDNSDVTLEAALLREVSEEMGDLPDGFQFLAEDYLYATRCEEKKVTFNDYLTIEKRSNNQPYEGFEVLGIIRVPLYKFRINGFPTFLRNNFIGCSKTQLLESIERRGILTQKTLKEYLESSKQNDPLSDDSLSCRYN